MPFLNSLKREGIFKVLRSSIPAVSSISWSSIITGTNPGEHGIFGFTEMIPNTYALSFPNFLSLRQPAFWQTNKERSVILNVPSTYPAQKINGCHISGFVSPNLEKAVYPESEQGVLEKLDYKIDLDSEKAKQSELVLYKELNQTHAKREELANYLWQKYDPDLFMLVITGSDRIGHFAWHHYQDSDHLSHHKFLDYFRKIDQTIKNLAERLNSADSLILLSDHGMERSRQQVNLNAYLIKAGLLELDDDRNKNYNRIKKETKAFALDFGRIYLNSQGRFPRGSVEKGKGSQIIAQLKELFDRIEINNRKVVKQIYQGPEIYQGEYLEKAPDLVLIPNPGFNLMGRLTTNFYRPSKLTGMHNDQGFLLVKMPHAREMVPENPSVEEIVPIINYS